MAKIQLVCSTKLAYFVILIIQLVLIARRKLDNYCTPKGGNCRMCCCLACCSASSTPSCCWPSPPSPAAPCRGSAWAWASPWCTGRCSPRPIGYSGYSGQSTMQLQHFVNFDIDAYQYSQYLEFGESAYLCACAFYPG